MTDGARENQRERRDRCAVPATLEEMARVIGTARGAGSAIEILGGGTQAALIPEASSEGVAASRGNLVISTLGWSGVDEFEPEEGVVHVRAGTTVMQVQEAVSKEGWELPLDPLRSVSTIGGAIATAYTGPRAQTFGRVADIVLGLEVMGADGVLRKAGGRVVKNVTGYDLAKLYCGSYGTLGIITGAWLRLRPAPAASCALRGKGPVSAQWIEQVRGWRDLPTLRVLTLVANAPGGSADGLFVELGGSEAEVAADRHQIEASGVFEEVSAETIDRLGRQRIALAGAAKAYSESEVVSLRAQVLGSALPSFVSGLLDRSFSVSADLGRSSVFAAGRFGSFAEFIDLRRQVEAAGGYLSVLSMPETWRAEVDALSLSGTEREFMHTLRVAFDPDGLLNPDLFRQRRGAAYGGR